MTTASEALVQAVPDYLAYDGQAGFTRKELLEHRRHTLASALRLGMSWQDAADAAGIRRDALQRYMRRHKDELEPALARERNRGKLAILGRLERASQDPRYWTAGAWLLERTYPNEYGQRQRLELDVRVLAATLQREFAAAGIELDDATLLSHVNDATLLLESGTPPA